VTPRDTARVTPSHAWLFDLLFGRAPSVTWANADALPSGYRRAERFLVLPGAGRRSFFVSHASRRAMSSALTSYNALRPGRRRLARRLISVGLRSGAAQPLLRGGIDIGTVSGATPEKLVGDLLTAHLAQLLGSGPVVVAFGGCSGPYRKPVLQVFNASGSPLGYVKVGWNEWSRNAVRQEFTALSARANRQNGLGVPAVLGLSVWQGLDLLITAPLPSKVRRLPADERQPGVGLLRAISELTPSYVSVLADSPWWRRLRARIADGMADPAAAARLVAVADRIEHSCADAKLKFGSWHGDLVPWNLAQLDDHLYAWDWESSEPDAPLGFDALHFHFQVAFVTGRQEVVEAAGVAASKARTAIEALGVDAAALPLLTSLHLFELLLRHEEAHSCTGDVDERFYPAVIQALEQFLAAAPGAPSRSSRGRAA
jgi:hypothetical protein